MKANGFFRKLNFLIALGGIFAALTFYGCGNLFSSADDAPANFTQSREGYGIVSGNLPSSDSASARTAMPTKPDETSLSYKVFAQSGSQKIEANVNNADRTFSIALPFGTWKITANGLLPNGRIIFTQTKEVTLDATTSAVSLNFELGYSTNPDDGDGEISLSVSLGDATSLIRGIEYILSKGEEKIIQNVSNIADFKIEHTTDNLGAWHLTIQFYGDFSNLVYRIDQTVNVYANLTTDTFEGSAPYISGGKIVLTKALLADFQNTTLYVNATSGKDTNTGTQFDPLQTFNRALELVNNSARSADTEFRIFLQTDVADGATLELKSEKKLTVASAGADGTARKITSLGRTFIVPATSELTVQSVKFKDMGFTVEGMLEMNNCSIDGGNSAGGVYINGNGTFTMNGGEIKDCHASLYGGGICIQQGTAEITGTNIIGCSAEEGGAVLIANAGTFTMNGGTISGNTANVNGGGIHVYGGKFIMEAGEISGNTASTNGGAVYVNTSGIFTMENGTISNNTTSTNNGGAIYINSGAFTMNDGSISGNTAEYGGGVYVDGGTFEMNGGSINGNTATTNGGAVYIYDGTFEIKDGTFSENSASNAGGAVYVRKGTFTISGSTISKNTANNGGGVDIYGGTGIMADCTINGNTATSKGGGIYVYTTGTFIMKDGRVGENKAGSIGGGVYVYCGTFTMEDGEISENSASANGGGFYVNDGTFKMQGGTIDRNASTASGGGVYVYSGTFEMEGGTFSGNKSTDKGNGAYVNPCTFKMSGAAKFAESDDIYLYDSNQSTFATIQIAGALSETKVATLTPSTYEAGREVLSAGVPITPDICGKFTLTPESNENDAEWSIAPDSTGAKGVLKTKMDFYVRGTGAGWYTENGYGNIIGNDSNPGDRMHPFETIQGAINEVIKQNDGASEYTIYVDGTLTFDGSGSGLARISGDNLRLKVVSLHPTQKATLDANERGQVMYFSGNSSSELTLERLVITGGKLEGSGSGWSSSGLYIHYGKATITDCEIKNNSMSSCSGGGGMYISYCNEVVMTGCTVSGNTATNTSGSPVGGIYTDHVTALTMTDCTVSGNISDRSNGGILIAGSNSKVTMTDCTVRDNISARAGGIGSSSGKLTMKGCTVSGNTATGDDSGGGVGGGISNSDYALLEIEDTEISGNTAARGAGIYSIGGTITLKSGAKVINNINGGGIYASSAYGSTTTLIMEAGAEVSDNTSLAEGGGILVKDGSTFTMNGGTIENNEAEKGGGVYVSGNASIFNMTGDTAKISGNKAHGDGGGVALNGGTFNMKGGTISINKAVYGAGIHVSGSGTFTMEKGTISGNIADGENDSGGGGIHLYDGTVEMSGGEISGNDANGTVSNSGGGGIYIYPRTTNKLTMTGGTISGNNAVKGGKGGGIYIGKGSIFTNIGGIVNENTFDEVYTSP